MPRMLLQVKGLHPYGGANGCDSAYLTKKADFSFLTVARELICYFSNQFDRFAANNGCHNR
ncbi:hypothetical protein [Paenibacillus silvisoli]|uniref:hypothetical protein n=1 Tax=Paenibacillus silvisoli TaxID=3110539 RepID=UPI002803AEA5|nr:hypothetical protein [Paenibacillus silvisoli]